MNEKHPYPDGQITAILGDFNPYIQERINSYEDLFYVRSLAEALHHNNVVPKIFIPCLFGQRSDRRFRENQSLDIKIIAEVINACKAEWVKILDPHSEAPILLIDKARRVDPVDYVLESLNQMPYTGPKTLIAPDAGAYKKVFDYAVKFHLPLVGALKHRDKDGKIVSIVIGDVKDQHCLIVDDLADGGYTFYLLGQQLKYQGAASVSLYVTHGYFNKGFDELKKVIDHVYCTNSVKDIADPYVTQFKVI